MLVYAETGDPTTLTGQALLYAQRTKAVITKSAYVQRQLVDAKTGAPTTLTGEALLDAQINQTVISKSAYAKRQLVDAETGEPTALTGQALLDAQTNRTVITKGAYTRRQFSRTRKRESGGDESSHATMVVDDTPSVVDVSPVSGLSSKYLCDHAARLPQLLGPAASLSSSAVSRFSAHLECVPLSACPPSSDRLESLFLLSFIDSIGGYGWTRTTDLSIMSAAL